MTYQVFITRRAQKDLEKLDKVVIKKIYQKLKLFQKNPLSCSKKLIYTKAGEYRYRIGSYRIIFNFKGHQVIILRIGHRSKIYK